MSGTRIIKCGGVHNFTEKEYELDRKTNLALKEVIVQRNIPCSSEFQDSEYGKDKRVANMDTTGGATCTVCGKRHMLTKDQK